MKKLILISVMALFIIACGNQNSTPPVAGSSDKKENTDNGNPSYDPKRGEGKFTKVEVSASLNATMATDGNKVYMVKCSACHKLTAEKLVGPGWKGITKRLTAEWIMNFASNPDSMIDKDPEAKAQLEICLVRMPNQNLNDKDARDIYEFMRKNDGVK
jgi:cytochrome c5